MSPPIARRLRFPWCTVLLVLGLAACNEQAPVAPTGSHTLAAPSVTPTVLPSDVVPCGEVTEVTLWAGQNIDVGTVTVANDEDSIYVTYAVTGGWTLQSTHLEVTTSLADVPTNVAGNPVVGQFTHQDTHAGVTEFTYTIARSDLGVEAGDELVVAAHADVYEASTDRSEGAWGAGSRFVEDGNWATYFGHTVQTCDVVLAPDELCSNHSNAAVATFADPALEDAVRDELDLSAEDELTCKLMGTLVRLSAVNAGIGDLQGIQNAVNLEELFLASSTFLPGTANTISNLGPLSSLDNLARLFLGENEVSDVSPLSGLTSLRALALNDNQIADVGPLSGLGGLTFLRLDGNKVSDLGPLSGLTSLGTLSLGFNLIDDIGPLSGLNALSRLTLNGNQVSDVGPLSGLTGLTTLTLTLNSIKDVGPLGTLTNLEFLSLGGNEISDISPLSGLNDLVSLSIGGNQISDLSPLSGLTGLIALGLVDNQITDIAPLSNLTNLTSLSLRDNEVSDLSPLSGLLDLERLFLALNQVTDVSPLEGLIHLTRLDLGGNTGLSDIRPLIDNTGLGTGDRVVVVNTAVPCDQVADLEAEGVTVVADCP